MTARGSAEGQDCRNKRKHIVVRAVGCDTLWKRTWRSLALKPAGVLSGCGICAQ